MTLVSLISLIFFIISYKYFQFGSDFYFKSNFLVISLLISIYVLWFFLGRFFPFYWDTSEDEKEEKMPVNEPKREVDFKDIAGKENTEKKDNLQLLEGIGPKVQELLYAHGIYSFWELAVCSIEKLEWILANGWDRFSLCNPSTWPYQAELAAAKNWWKLKEYQDFLLRGAE